MILTKYISDSIKNGIRSIKVTVFGVDIDTRTALQAAPHGDDSSPIKGMQAIYSETSKNGNPVIIGYINKNALADVGEKRIFATDADGALKGYIWLKNNEDILIGGDANHMTQYEALKQGLDTYINSLNAAITTGVASAGGTYTPPTSPLDISGAKLTKIKTM